MIITHFDDLRDIRTPSIVIDMPHPVRVDEYVEINGESLHVTSVTWIIESGKPMELVARVK